MQYPFVSTIYYTLQLLYVFPKLYSGY